jgi:hypothetical protein
LATKTFGHVAGNWSTNALWEEGTAPESGDDVVFDAGSANCVVNSDTNYLKSLDMTGYTGTLSGIKTIRIRGLAASTNVCKLVGLGTWTGGLFFAPVSTSAVINFTSNGELLTTMICGWSDAVSLVVLQDNLSFTAAKTNTLTLTYKSLDLNGKTISGNSSINRLLITSGTLGTAVDLTVNGGTFAHCDFRDITFINGANLDLSAITGGSGDCGGNTCSGFTLKLTTADDWYWYHVDAGTFNFSGNADWYTQTAGGGVALVNEDATCRSGDGGNCKAILPQDNCYFDASSCTGEVTVDQDMPRMCKTLDFTSVDAMAFHMDNISQRIYGGLLLVDNCTLTANSTSYPIIFESMDRSGSYNFTQNDDSIGTNIYIDTVSGIIKLASNLVCTETLLLEYGTFDADTYNVTTRLFNSNVSTARTLLMGSGTWTLTATTNTQPWNTLSITGLTNPTTFAETSTLIFGSASTSGQEFRTASGLTFNNVSIVGGSTQIITMTGSNTFNTFTINAPKTVKFTAGTVTTIKKLKALGVTLTSVTANNYFLKILGDMQVYGTKISRCVAVPPTRAYGAIDAGNNSGLIFSGIWDKMPVAAPPTGYGMMCTTIIES